MIGSERKTSASRLLDPEKYELFESRFKGLGKPTEGEIAMSMQHPKIVQTYEHGVSTKGERVLIMEYVGGHSLQDLIVRKRTNITDGNELMMMRDMAESLGYVHDQDYIHRDVCPRNFITTPRGRHGQNDRLWIDRAGDRPLHGPGQPHRHAAVHVPRNRPPPENRSPRRHLFARRDVLLPAHDDRTPGRARSFRAGRHSPTTPNRRRRSSSGNPSSTPSSARAIMRMIHPDVEQRMS